MPGKTPKQRRLFGMIANAKKQGKVSRLSGKARKISQTVTLKTARKMARKK